MKSFDMAVANWRRSILVELQRKIYLFWKQSYFNIIFSNVMQHRILTFIIAKTCDFSLQWFCSKFCLFNGVERITKLCQGRHTFYDLVSFH